MNFLREEINNYCDFERLGCFSLTTNRSCEIERRTPTNSFMSMEEWYNHEGLYADFTCLSAEIDPISIAECSKFKNNRVTVGFLKNGKNTDESGSISVEPHEEKLQR